MTLLFILILVFLIIGSFLLFRWQYHYQLTDKSVEIRAYGKVPLIRFPFKDIEQGIIHRDGPIAALCGGFVGDWDITAHNYANRLWSQSYVEIRTNHPSFLKVTLTPENPDDFVARIMAAKKDHENQDGSKSRSS